MINVDLGEAYGNWTMGPDNELMSLVSCVLAAHIFLFHN